MTEKEKFLEMFAQCLSESNIVIHKYDETNITIYDKNHKIILDHWCGDGTEQDDY